MNDQSFVKSFIMNDDCCQLVFEYLTLEQKCRLERVSKQFMKLVYRSQWKFSFDNDFISNITNEYGVIDIDLFKCVIKKCHNVKDIDCYRILINDLVLDVITDYCLRLKAISLNLEDVTEDAITRFGQRFGHQIRHIKFYKGDQASRENERILLNLCPNIRSLICRNLDTLNAINSTYITKLYLIYYAFWSDEDVNDFGRIVDRYQNTIRILGIYAEDDIQPYLDVIFQHIGRLPNLKVFDFFVRRQEVIQNQVPTIKHLGRGCKKLKKVTLDFSNDSFNLWQVLSDCDALEVLEMEASHGNELVLLDSKVAIKPLLRLKKIKIRCQSIGFFFFEEMTEFCPNIKILYLNANYPNKQLSYDSLIALSKCKQLSDLQIYVSVNYSEGELGFPIVDDIGLIPLLDNCTDTKRIGFPFLIDSIILTLAKWIEMARNAPKKTITFECFVYKTDTVISDMGRLDNLTRLSLTNGSNWRGRYFSNDGILFQCDRNFTVSIDLFFKSYMSDRKDIWQILSRYKSLEEFAFCYPEFDFYESVPNIEPLMSLKEVTIECLQINNGFFGNITKMAPNLEVFELKSRFDLSNRKLKVLSKLSRLRKVNLMSLEKKDHEASDKGVIRLLNSCERIEDIVFDFEIEITIKTIDKLIELAKGRPKEKFRFQCFVSSPELQSNQLSDLPNNLIIQTKYLKQE